MYFQLDYNLPHIQDVSIVNNCTQLIYLIVHQSYSYVTPKHTNNKETLQSLYYCDLFSESITFT